MIETQLIPIEYDQDTEEEALSLKRCLENNAPLFQAFLTKYKKITFIDTFDETAISISSIDELKDMMRKSIPNYLETLNEQMFPASNMALMEIACLKLLLADKYKAYESYETLHGENNVFANINSIYTILSLRYYQEQETPDKVIDFFFDPTEAEKEKIFTWLNSRRRYDLINHLLEEQYQILIQADNEQTAHDEFLKQNLAQVLKLSEVDFLNGNIILPSKTPEIDLPKLSQDDLDKLCIEFFIKVDPSLKWLKIYNKLKAENRIVYTKKEQSPQVEWECTFTPETGAEIMAPLDGTIQDFKSFIHEFAHCVSFLSLNKDENVPRSLAEYPSIFFEIYALKFLKDKGYSQEIIDELLRQRSIVTQDNKMDICPTLGYLLQFIEKGPITFESEKEKQEQLFTSIEEDISEDIKQLLEALLSTDGDENVHIKVDAENAFLVQYPIYVSKAYPYIIGKYFATKTFEQVTENPQLIYTVLEITEDLHQETIDSITKKIGLSDEPFTSSENNNPQYTKTFPTQQG